MWGSLLSRTHDSLRPKILQTYTGDGYLLIDAQGALERILLAEGAPPAEVARLADARSRQSDFADREQALDLYARLRAAGEFRACPHGHPILLPMVRRLPARAGRFVLALADQEVTLAEHEILIRTEQGVSFGNGSHETTQMALTLLQEHLLPGQRVADVGCGTAILSIAAAKLGAGEIVAVDTDPLCILEAQDNLALNDVHDEVTLIPGSSDRLKGEFDLVLANMSNAPMILEIAPAAVNWLRPGGILIVGGIYAYGEFSLENRTQLVREGLTPLGLSLLNALNQKHCVTLSWRKNT